MIDIRDGDALGHYGAWPAPTVIVSDGAYGVRGFPGDPGAAEDLPAWYAPHVEAWGRHALPSTTLWFWCTEVGWANVHSMLLAGGWEYRALNVWDKGIEHVAGNVNTKTIRQFPIATEVCAHYVRRAMVAGVPLQGWLRAEWKRTKLGVHGADVACSATTAASRKYLAADWRWYAPPVDEFVRLAAYADVHGAPSGAPYFTPDPTRAMTPAEREAWYAGLRARFDCPVGWTNCWRVGAVRGAERVKDGAGVVHGNQKPTRLMDLIIAASSAPGDVVWEPFGGLCTASVVGHQIGRACYAAELDPDMCALARRRAQDDCAQVRLFV